MALIDSLPPAQAGNAVHVVRCDDPDSAWNALIESDAHRASAFHLLEWRRIISRAYGHDAHYLLATESGRVTGILPLFFIKSRLFGRALVSLPFTDYGGICANTQPAVTALLEEALSLGRTLHADYVQLRHREPVSGVPASEPHKETFLLELSDDPQRLWTNLPSERRNRIKKARRMGVTSRLAGAEGLEAFYRVFSENMRDIGSPVHSPEFFRQILAELDERAKILLVERGREAIGGAICLFFRDTLHIPWVSSLRRHFALNPNMILYWTAIEYACLNGYRTLDFGRSSKGSGTYEFKRQWGATPHQLPWSSYPLNGKPAPTFAPEGLRDRLMIECWKRLPLAVSRHLGPRVRRLIPA